MVDEKLGPEPGHDLATQVLDREDVGHVPEAADEERAAVFAKAQEEGVSQGDVSRALFERWLSEPPPANLLAMWKDYVRALMETMSVEDRRFFKGRVLDRARGVG